MTMRSHVFGRFEIRPRERELRVDGRAIRVGARAFDLLLVLVQRRDRVVSKTELLQAVWPHAVVEEANLHVHVCALRKVLGAGVIATIPGRGYRFIAGARGETPPDGQPVALASQLPDAGMLIGRDADVLDLEEMVAQRELVTVAGPGGVGKTRLALELARRSAGRYAEGICWVDLAPVPDGAKVAAIIAQTMRIDMGAIDPAEALPGLLSGREALLVLDNCEHLAADAAGIAAALLARDGPLRILATSREPLKLAREWVYHLEPLAVPPRGTRLHRSRTYSAVQLFEQRAQANDQHFALNDDTLEQAIELCRRLDGLPLAIEMAAARAWVVGVAQLNAHLGGQLELLRSNTRTSDPRHATLLATLEWSYGLLDGAQARALRRLAVVAAGFRLETARDVVGGGSDAGASSLDAVTGLIDRSLLQVEGEDPRCRLLETTKLFALEKLRGSGESHDAQRAHCRALAHLAQAMEREYWSRASADWIAAYAVDYNDLQLAFDRAYADRDADAAATIGDAMRWMDLERSAGGGVVRDRLRVALQLLPDATGAARARLLNLITTFRRLPVEGLDPVVAARERLAQWREVGDEKEVYLALGRLADFLAWRGEYATARAAIEEASGLESREWPAMLRVTFLNLCAWAYSQEGDLNALRSCAELMIRLAQEAGAPRIANLARVHLAVVEVVSGSCGEAIRRLESTATEMAAAGQLANGMQGRITLMAASLLQGDMERARAAARRALELTVPNEIVHCLYEPVAMFAALTRRPAPAARLLALAASRRSRHARLSNPVERMMAEGAARAIAEAALSEELQRWREEGASLSEDQAESLMHEVLA
jgi:predicted ATPase/DNA-binding winged helix-turn-helix (wHTH) protein